MDPTPCRCCGVDWKPGQEGQRDHPQCWYVGFTKQHSFPPCFCETWAWAWTIYTRVKWRQFIRIKRGYVLFCSCLIFLEFFWLQLTFMTTWDVTGYSRLSRQFFVSCKICAHFCKTGQHLDKFVQSATSTASCWGGGGQVAKMRRPLHFLVHCSAPPSLSFTLN